MVGDAGSSTTGTFKNHSILGLPVTKNGYIYVWVSNESKYNVFFDNLQLIHNRGPVLEETHYYPFGLTMAGISIKAMNFGGPENKKKWNAGSELQNKEFSDGSGLELYATQYRSLDPQLGRFWQIDPLTETTNNWTPYAFVQNNPIRFADPNGADTLDIMKNDDGKWIISNTQIVKGDDVFRVKIGEETKTYTFSEGEYGERLNVLNVENNDDYTLGIYHISGQDGDGATGYAVTPGGTSSTKVGSGKRLPDDTFTLSETGNGKDQSAYKWVQPLLHSGENGGYVGGRGVKIHPAPSTATETKVGQWTEGCFVVSTDYSLKNGTIYYNSKLSIATSKQINTMLGATKHYDATGTKKRPGSDFGNGIKFKLIQKTGF